MFVAKGASSSAHGSPGPGSTGHGAFFAAASAGGACVPVTSAIEYGVPEVAGAAGLCSSDRSVLAPHARAAWMVPIASPRANTAAIAPKAIPSTNHSTRFDRRRRPGWVVSSAFGRRPRPVSS